MKIRAFIALELKNKETIFKINDFTSDLNKIQPRMKAVEAENLHITMKFLGNIEESQAKQIYRIINDTINDEYFKDGPKTFSIKGTGQFNKYTIIWAKIVGDIQFLQSIKDTLENSLYEELSIEKDKRSQFKAHLTIGRLKTNNINYNDFNAFKNLINGNKASVFGEFSIGELLLKKSDLTPKGPIYTTLKY